MGGYYASIAKSLERIADALEKKEKDMAKGYFITQSRFHSEDHVSDWTNHSFCKELPRTKKAIEVMQSDGYHYADYRIINDKGEEVQRWLKR